MQDARDAPKVLRVRQLARDDHQQELQDVRHHGDFGYGSDTAWGDDEG